MVATDRQEKGRVRAVPSVGEIAGNLRRGQPTLSEAAARYQLAESLVLGAMLAIAVSNCGRAKPVEHAASATSLYSFRYYGGRRTLYIHIPAYDPALTCASFSASMARQYSDAWYLDLYVAWETPSTQALVGTLFPPTGDSAALAYLDVVHARSSEQPKWLVSSVGGTVTFASAPLDEDAQVQGIQLAAHLDFSLPKQRLALISCQVNVSPRDGGGFLDQQTCTCQDETGNTSTCVGPTEAACCTAPTSSVESFSLEIVANPCGALCLSTAGDFNGCSGLYGTMDRDAAQ
jgi:hypothetical protein